MLVSVTRVLLVLLLSGLRVQSYEDYEDISEEESGDDYANYDVVDEEETVVTPTIVSEDEDIKSVRVRRDQDEEAVSTSTLGPEDLGEVREALNQLLSRTASNNPFTPHRTPLPSVYRPSLKTNTTITSTTPSYSMEETTQTEDLSTASRVLENASDEYSEGWPTRSSEIAYEIKSNLERELFLRNGTNGSSSSTAKTASTARTPQLDIAKLLEIISGLAEDFETNLTRRLNESIAGMELPTCTTPTPPTTTQQTTVTDEYDANYTGVVVAKCFVCGLDIPGIPQHAHCADAFAGDFLPLVPVDTRAKGKLSRFRKYCKYANIEGYRTKQSQPNVIIGRWTGGCAVRWIDLSGVYTQRTCRNRVRPTMGLHYASKRMAKLESALWNIDNGCITSPVATLTPLSRGVSLYARFHACVCAGSWCNAARVNRPYHTAALCAALISTAVLGVT